MRPLVTSSFRERVRSKPTLYSNARGRHADVHDIVTIGLGRVHIEHVNAPKIPRHLRPIFLLLPLSAPLHEAERTHILIRICHYLLPPSFVLTSPRIRPR